ncbi:hypothetical protein Hanom_Chr08g00709891 [Helianthus anomalus]
MVVYKLFLLNLNKLTHELWRLRYPYSIFFSFQQGNAQNIMMFFSVSNTRLSRPQMPDSTPPCTKMKMII